MIKYILGFFVNFLHSGVSCFARVDHLSKIYSRARIHRYAHIYNSIIGEYTYIGVKSHIVYSEVGKFCSIGEGCMCGMGVHTLNFLSTSPIFTEKHNALGISWTDKESIYPFKKLIIGNDVWIGARVIIMGGLTIGDGAVIGAGAVVTKDVPPYAIVAGVPAKIIRYRFDEESISKLLSLRWWDKEECWLKGHIKAFQENMNKSEIENL